VTFEDLLAIIHGDGGHHTLAVGLEQSIADAAEEIYKMRTSAGVCLTAEEVIEIVRGKTVKNVELDFNDACDPLKMGLIGDAVMTRKSENFWRRR
jgi:hypothetical protein